MFYPTHFGSGQSNSDTARKARDPDLSYRLGIMLEADRFALREAHNRNVARRIFADARALRRQMQEA